MSAGPLTSLDAARAIMAADMASGRASTRSLGVMHALILAGAGDRLTDPEFWRPINEPISKQFGPRYLNGVKKVGWSIFEEVGRKGAPS